MEVNEPILRRMKCAQEEWEKLEKEKNRIRLNCSRLSFSLSKPLSLFDLLANGSLDSLPLYKQVEKWKEIELSLIKSCDEMKKKISNVINDLSSLCNVLECSIDDLFEEHDKKIQFECEYDNNVCEFVENLSVKRYESYKNAITLANLKIEELKMKILDKKQEIIKLWDELEFSNEKRKEHPVDVFVATNEYNYNNVSKKKLCSLTETLKVLEERKSELGKIYHRLHGAVKELMPKIWNLWKLLKIPTSDKPRLRLWYSLMKQKNPPLDVQRNFIKKLIEEEIPSKFPVPVIEAVETEYNRLKELESLMMKKLILEERKILFELWDKLHFGKEQREQFIPGFSEEYTRETLEAIKAEIKRLQGLWTTMSSLLKQIERREWIKSEMKRFERTASDPNRFKGSSTRLLEEEKFRKIVAKEFPRLTNSLRKTLMQWQHQHGGEAFYYEGEPYIETMNKEEENPNFELLHLRLLTSKPNSNTNSSEDIDFKSPTMKSVADRQVKPVVRSQPRPIRPSSVLTQNRNEPATTRQPGRTSSSRRRDDSGSLTPLRSTKPHPK